ncbi:alpha/beta fold hydrolase [Rhodobacteraceae bacterium F11138]|nr:alpha/beta fold hydrolase [Rhodobacteraceae bacterium F11138]
MSLVPWLILAVLLCLLAVCVLRTRSLARAAERQVPQVGHIQKVRGGSVHYVDLGPRDATPLVLIHGLSGQLQHFTYAIADMLSDQYRVIALDRPGCGYSQRDSDDLATPGEQARMIGEALDALGLGKTILVGHSLGGTVALTMALERPKKTAALALLCPATQNQTEVPEAFKGLMVKSPVLRRLIGHTIAAPMAAATKDKVLAMVFAPETCPADFMLRGGAALGMRPQAFVTASADATGLQAQAADITARYDTDLQVPGGILFGAADPILSPDVHGRTMQKYGLEFETLQGRGHMIPITAPADCADFIIRMAAKTS